MTTAGDVAPVSPAPAEAEKPNSFQRIAGVLFNPGETFESIARRPDVLVPLLVFVVISIIGGVLIGMHVDWHSLAREAIEMNPNVPPDRVDKAAGLTSTIMKVTAYASPLLAVVVLALVAGVLLISFRMFGGEGDYKQAFSVTTYAWFPRLIKAILAMVVLTMKASPSLFELQNPLMSNLGFLFDPKTQPLAYAIGTSLDIFSIWSVILLIIGFAAVSRFKRGRAATVVVTLWILGTLLSLIGPAMQAMRAHQ